MIATHVDELARNWWTIAIRGAAAILFGIMALLLPDLALETLVLLFGVYALVDGLFSIFSAVRAAQQRRKWWTLLIVGVAGLGAGVVTFVWPDITAIALLYLIAAWAIVRGVFEVVAALQLRQHIRNELLLILSGILSVAFGVIIAVDPGAGALALVWVIGFYAILAGLLLLGVAWRLRGIAERHSGLIVGVSGPTAATRSGSPGSFKGSGSNVIMGIGTKATGRTTTRTGTPRR